MKTIKKIFFPILILCLLPFLCSSNVMAIDVTFTVDENVTTPQALKTAEQNLARVLTEINAAQSADRDLSMKNFAMDDFAKKSLARIWAVTPFKCDDEEVVDRCWVFKDGTMMASHIPLIIMAKDEKYGQNVYQEAVVEFDAKGSISDFRFSLGSQMSESMAKCGSVASNEMVEKIWKQLEQFRTAYNTKDISTIEAMFSDDALIITGKVVMRKAMADSQKATYKVEYSKQNKTEYINNLKKAFKRNTWINVTFSKIGDNGESGGCAGITQSKEDPTKFGVRLRQSWKSEHYSDEGYLFLLWEFPKEGDPIIHVRTWQPEWEGSTHLEPDDDISTLSGFGL